MYRHGIESSSYHKFVSVVGCFAQRRREMTRALTTEEKSWCLEQAIAMVKEFGRGAGPNNMREAAGTLQSLYQTLCALRCDLDDEG
jgi:hypothetical protein